MLTSKRVLLSATLSGFLCYGLLMLAGEPPAWLPVHGDVLRALPGLIFGLLVLQIETRGFGRRIAVIMACGLIWYAAFKLAGFMVADQQKSTLLACGVAGGLAAWLVSLVVRLIKPRRLSLLAMLMAFVAGTLGGCLIGEALLESDLMPWTHALLIAGFIVWQAGVGSAMLLVDELGADDPHA